MRAEKVLLAHAPLQSTQAFTTEETVTFLRYPPEFLLWYRQLFPGLSSALEFWQEARVSSPEGLPMMAATSSLIGGSLGQFINYIDVSNDNPDNYMLRRSPRAQAIRNDHRAEFVPLVGLPRLYQHHQTMSIFSAKGLCQPVFRAIRRTEIDFAGQERHENYVSLLLPIATRSGLRQPDGMLSVFDWLMRPEAPAWTETDRRAAPLRRAGTRRR